MFKKCRHKYVGRFVYWETTPLGQPMVCHLCSKAFVSDVTRSIRMPLGSKIDICQECLEALRCGKCKTPLRGHFSVAECIACGDIKFFCKDCADKKLFINMDKQERPEVIAGKIFSLMQDLIKPPQKQGPLARFFGSFRKKKPKSPVELFPLIMNINMFFTDPYDVDEFMDGDIGNEDWWMN